MYIFYKRFFDVLISLMALIVFSPLLLILALILAFMYKGNPFFSHLRPGYQGRPFWIYKFRTMTEPAHACQNEEERLTQTGIFLRRYSLDELPQLWNVLKGDMSLVGPRPLLCEYLPLYSPYHQRRHHVKPGITGWAQVNGRNAIPWEERLDMDVYYVENADFILDMKIIFSTASIVLTGYGVNAKGRLLVGRYSNPV